MLYRKIASKIESFLKSEKKANACGEWCTTSRKVLYHS